MKKILIMAGVVAGISMLSNCHSAKKSAGKATAPTTVPSTAAAVTYHSNMESVIAANCSPCHFPSKGGNKTPFDTYDAAKSHLDSMIARIQLNPTDKGFMPFKRSKLSDSTINLFKQWRESGTPQ
jgi:nitrate/TMAO reductase-like tetraheme cytochrome c subunit